MNYFYEKDFMNTKKKKKKKKNQNFPLLISKYDFVSFSHALYQLSLYLQKWNYFYDNHYINTE